MSVSTALLRSALALHPKRERAAAVADFLSWAKDRFGARRALQLLAGSKAHIAANGHRTRVARVPLPAEFGPHDVRLRIDTSDPTVYEQIFLEQEYRLDDVDPEFILDAGAHVGMTSMYFALRYPRAKIVAVEPDRDNWTLARENTAVFKNVTVLRGALWNREAHLGIGNPDASSWGFRMVEDLVAQYANRADCGLSIPGFTVSSLLEHFRAARIGIFKMDIEGSEVEVLPTVPMDRVDVLACETHDRYKPGCTEALRAATPGWREELRKDTHILRR
jgi:FkbM family methyltransferase